MIATLLGLVAIGFVIMGMLGVFMYAMSPLFSAIDDALKAAEKRGKRKVSKDEKLQALMKKREGYQAQIHAKKNRKK